MAILHMHNASGHHYGNSSFIVELDMGQRSRSTERISSLMKDRLQIKGADIYVLYSKSYQYEQ